MIELMSGDNRQSLRRMIDEGRFVDSVCCDPPYGLTSVTKRFGSENAAPAKFGSDGLFQRQSGGMMGKRWDGTGIERNPEFWRLVWEVMKPGAYIIAFSSTRTYHHMAVAMEEAGFITHPMFAWLFFTGFPKGHEPSRFMTGEDQERWKGWKTGTQSLKPALEPVYFGQKPFSEKTGALNILKHGVGAVNIDGCRVDAFDKTPAPVGQFRGSDVGATGLRGVRDGSQDHLGRYPANLVHDGSPDVVALFPQSGGAAALASGPTQTGEYKSGSMAGHFKGTDVPPPFYGDSGGSAARFFNSFPHEGPVLCYPKAGKADRAWEAATYTLKDGAPDWVRQEVERLLTR